MKITNHWITPEGSRLAATIVETIAAFGPQAPSFVEFRREDGLPYVEIAFNAIIHPAYVVIIGNAIQEVTGLPVWFHSLGAASIDLYVEGDFLLERNEFYRDGRFEEVGTLIKDLEPIWAPKD